MIKNKFDVVIIGASFAGLICARELAKSKLSVLVVEKNIELGKKPCGHGVTSEDLKFIGREQMNFPLTSLMVGLSTGEKLRMPEGHGLISSIIRPSILNKIIKNIKTHRNIEIRMGSKAVKITNNTVTLGSEEEIGFNYLVGCDGSMSMVRKYLNLPVKKFMIALHYILTNTSYKDFEMHEDNELFGSGYAWIFPNKNFTSIGAAMDSENPSFKNIHANLKRWLVKKNIDVKGVRFEGSIINYDYQGYKFGNIFLAGDSAGIGSGLTGKGIFGACVSGKKVAREILGDSNPDDSFEEWLKTKQEEEQELQQDQNFLETKVQIINKLKS